MKPLTFEAPDLEAFPALRLAKESLVKGASHLVALNAANEVFVAAFLEKKIQFLTEKKAVEQLKELKFRRLKAMEDSACQLQ